jgi:hypothetical protein
MPSNLIEVMSSRPWRAQDDVRGWRMVRAAATISSSESSATGGT